MRISNTRPYGSLVGLHTHCATRPITIVKYTMSLSTLLMDDINTNNQIEAKPNLYIDIKKNCDRVLRSRYKSQK